MYIERQISVQLLSLVRHFPVTALIGPRQAGKTTLAKKLIAKIDKPCLYLDLELDEDYTKLSEAQIFLEQQTDRCVIIDEIQRLPSLFPLMRSLVDQKRIWGRFILLGSASPKLIQYSSESLAGRIAYEELTPFSLSEIRSIRNMEHHWIRGGYPEPLLAEEDSIAQVWMRNFIQTYLERDLSLLGLNADPVLMRRFWTMLAHFHGQIWNAVSFSKALGITSPTVTRYLYFMEAAFLVRQLLPFHVNLGKRLVKAPKVFIRDTGMLHHLAGIQSLEQLQGNVLIGHSWEGYVIEQIARMVPDDISLHYYRTHNGSEVDCVLVRGGQPAACIEIKYTVSPKPDKGFKIAIGDLGTEKNFIIIPRSGSYALSREIEVCGLDFFIEERLMKL